MSARKKQGESKRTKATGSAGARKGDVIERTFKGKSYKLVVTDDGYRIGKKTYGSLTAAAKAVTGYPSISGPRFWGAGGAK